MATDTDNINRPGQTPNTGQARTSIATSGSSSADTMSSVASTGANATTQPLTSATAADTNAAQPQDEGDDQSSDEEDDDSDYSDHSSDYDSDGFELDRDGIEKLIERKNRLFATDGAGVLQWLQHESSYTLKEICRRSKYSATFMYDMASPEELRRYVRDRGLPDPYPQGLTLKYLYIHLLEQDDKVKSFRFLDLPAEMRNLIYAQLLIFGRCTNCPRIHESCHTGILRANKQVYKEARNILYGDNEIRCTFGACGYDDDDPANFFSWMHVSETREQEDSMDKVFLGMSQIPDWFRRIQCLRVDLDFSGGSVSSAGCKLQACLLNLASFLMDEHHLKKLKIVVTDSSEGGDGDGLDEDGNIISTRLDAIIYPLRRLRGIEQVELIGVDEGLAKSTVAEMQKTSAPIFNTLLHFNNLREEAKSYQRVLQAVDPGLEDPEDLPGRGDRGERLSDALELLVAELGDYEEIDDEIYDPFANANAETNTRRKMEELRDCLSKVQFVDFERRKKEFIKLRKARTAYQMKSKWVYVDGKKKKSDMVLRRDWEPRLDSMDYW